MIGRYFKYDSELPVFHPEKLVSFIPQALQISSWRILFSFAVAVILSKISFIFCLLMFIFHKVDSESILFSICLLTIQVLCAIMCS